MHDLRAAPFTGHDWRMKHCLRLVTVLLLLPLSSGCVLAIGNKGQASSPKVGASEEVDEELVAAERELKLAQLELTLTQKKSEHALAEKREGVEQKRAARAAAEKELQLFELVTLPHKLAAADIELDDAKKDVWEAEQELEELKAMYSKEQFAERAKELVLGRGEKNLALAKRKLELATAERKALQSGELAQQATKLAEELRQADVAQQFAQNEVALAEMEAQTELEKARGELAAKERALVKAKSGEKGGGKESAQAGA